MRYNPALDGIRAIAILFVLGHHTRPALLPGGFLGVDVFFVLSGYLITTLLLAERERTGGINVLSFYGRRARRLYPALLSMLAAYLAVGGLIWPEYGAADLLRHAALSAVYVSDYVRAGPLHHTWSLSVEEQFYLVWPPLLLLALRLPRSRALAALGLIYALQAAERLYLAGGATPTEQLQFTAHFHSTGLILGCMLALAPRVRLPKRAVHVAAVGALAYLVGVSVLFGGDHVSMYAWTIPLGEIAAAVLVLSARDGASWLGVAPLARLGVYSYGVYLWHVLFFVPLYGQGTAITLLVGSAASVAVAALSYHTVEAAFRTKRVTPARTAPSAA